MRLVCMTKQVISLSVWRTFFECVYKGAPNDCSAWVSEDGCKQRVLRCGTFLDLSDSLRSAYRVGFDTQVSTTTSGSRLLGCSASPNRIRK